MSKRNKKINFVSVIACVMLVFVIISAASFLIVDSRFWKEKISPRFDGVDLTESINGSRDNLVSKIEYLNPTVYRISLSDAREGDVITIHNEYDAYWYAKELNEDTDGILISNPHRSNINNFVLREDGDYVLEIFYAPNRWKEYILVSVILLTPLLVVSYMVFKAGQSKNRKK